MENEIPQNTKRGLKSLLAPILASKKKRAAFWLVVAVAILVLGLTIAAVTGTFVATFKTPGQKVIVQPNICGDDTINKYNEIMTDYYGDTSGELATELNDLVGSITKKSNYKSDSNCIFIAYKAATLKSDFATAKGYADMLETLFNQGHFIDGRVKGLLGLTEIQKSAVSKEVNYNE